MPVQQRQAVGRHERFIKFCENIELRRRHDRTERCVMEEARGEKVRHLDDILQGRVNVVIGRNWNGVRCCADTLRMRNALVRPRADLPKAPSAR